MRSARKFIRREKRKEKKKKNFCESFHMLSWSTSICTSRGKRSRSGSMWEDVCFVCCRWRLSIVEQDDFSVSREIEFFLLFFLFSFPSSFVECQWKHGKIKEIIIKHFYCRPIEREKNARCRETGWPIVGQRRFILSLNQSALSPTSNWPIFGVIKT